MSRPVLLYENPIPLADADAKPSPSMTDAAPVVCKTNLWSSWRIMASVPWLEAMRTWPPALMDAPASVATTTRRSSSTPGPTLFRKAKLPPSRAKPDNSASKPTAVAVASRCFTFNCVRTAIR